MWKLPLFDTSFDEQESRAVDEVIRSGWLTMGEKTAQFEQAFADVIAVKHAVAVTNGTAALHLAHLVLDIGPGDEVICPSLSFVAAANVIVYTGATPVFVDITGENDLTMSPESIESNITPATKAIQVLHYAGHPADMDRIAIIAKNHGLNIIEDCAHAPGSAYNDQKCGTIGDLGCFSFFSNKNLTTAEGGMITTDNDTLAQRLRKLRSHGMTSVTWERHQGHAFSYNVPDLGYNYRIDEIRSALGLVQLQKLPYFQIKRNLLAEYYRTKLTDAPNCIIPFQHSINEQSNHIFPLILSSTINRRHCMQYLKDRGIQTSIHYPPIHCFEYYRRIMNNETGSLSVTEDIARREITLPLYPGMTKADVAYVCDALKNYLSQQAQAA